MKKVIIGIFIGMIIMCGIGVVAYNYSARDIEYNPTDSSWNVNTVGDAIDSLNNTIQQSNKDIEIISYKRLKTGTLTINPDIGTYIICVGTAGCSSNLTDIFGSDGYGLQFASAKGWGIYMKIYKVTTNPVTLSAGNAAYDFGYAIVRAK